MAIQFLIDTVAIMSTKENKFLNFFFINIILIPLFIRPFSAAGTTTKNNKILNLGFLKHRKYPQVLGAVSLAVQRINNDSNILPNVKLEFQYAELQPSKIFTFFTMWKNFS